MIYSVKGTLTVKELGFAVIECGLTEYIVYIMGEKSFFEALFASRIDTLTDNTGLIYSYTVNC